MHYVIGDIHNNNRKFAEMLKKIGFSQEDHFYLLGDLFDWNSWEPDPIGVYFNMLKLENRCTVVRGNHDTWLAQYIMYYFNFPEKKRKRLEPYPYNSFDLLMQRFTQVDMLNLAEKIMEWPLQVCIEVDRVKYLLAHACTSMPDRVMIDEYYLMGSYFSGDEAYEMFLADGKEGYISVCGHDNIKGEWKNLEKQAKECLYV